MFVTKKAHLRLEAMFQAAVQMILEANRKHDKLVARIENLGGERFLREARIHAPTGHPALSSEDINCLIRLAHPDRHGGSKLANDMTAKLLALRG